MAFTQALYYPHIDIRNEGWLKTSALFWDRIQTIVPASVKSPYAARTAREFADAGIIVPLRVSPDMDEMDRVADEVIQSLRSGEYSGLIGAAKASGRVRLHPDKVSDRLKQMYRLHPEKMAEEMRWQIEHLGLGRLMGGSMVVDSEFGLLYMTLLATRLSERLGLGLLTDTMLPQRLSALARTDAVSLDSDFHFEHRARRPRRAAPKRLAEGMLVELIVQQMGIDPKTPAVKVLEFRDAHKDEIGKFRTEISSITEDIPQNLNADSLRQYVSDKYENSVSPAIQDLKHALQSSRIKWSVDTWMKVSFLSVSSTSLLMGAGLTVPQALLASAGVSLIGTGVLYNQAKKKLIRENPYSYIVALDKSFGTTRRTRSR